MSCSSLVARWVPQAHEKTLGPLAMPPKKRKSDDDAGASAKSKAKSAPKARAKASPHAEATPVAPSTEATPALVDVATELLSHERHQQVDGAEHSRSGWSLAEALEEVIDADAAAAAADAPGPHGDADVPGAEAAADAPGPHGDADVPGAEAAADAPGPHGDADVPGAEAADVTGSQGEAAAAETPGALEAQGTAALEDDLSGQLEQLLDEAALQAGKEQLAPTPSEPQLELPADKKQVAPTPSEPQRAKEGQRAIQQFMFMLYSPCFMSSLSGSQSCLH
jgi:hypothetical protein